MHGRRERNSILIVTFGIFVLHLAFSASVHQPRIFSDETAYMANARYLAGVGAHFNLDGARHYYPGYSLFLVPLFKLIRDPETLYRSIIVLNCLISAVTVWTLYLIGKRVLSLSHRSALIVAALVSLYPSSLIFGSYAMTESIFVLAFSLVILAFDWLISRPSFTRSVLFALLTSLTLAIHPRSIPFLPIVAVFMLFTTATRQLKLRYSVLPLVVPFLSYWALRAVNRDLHDVLYANHIKEDLTRIGKLKLGHMLGSFALQMIGQAWYLAVATYGLAVIGFIGAIVFVMRRIHARGFTAIATDRQVVVVNFALALMTGALVVSALTSTPPARADQAIYGRYNEGWLPVLLVFGVGLLIGLRKRRVIFVSYVVSAGVIAGLGLGLKYGRKPDIFSRTHVDLNNLGILPVITRYGFRIAFITAISMALVTAIYFLFFVMKRSSVSFIAVGALFVATALYGQVTYANRGDDVIRTEEVRAQLANLKLKPEKVAFDEKGFSVLPFYSFQFWLPETRFELFDGKRKTSLPYTYMFSTNFDVRGYAPQARIVYIHPQTHTALYVQPGTVQEQLARKGYLLPLGYPVRLPDEALRAKLSLKGGSAYSLDRGEDVEIPVKVDHLGKSSPWANFGPGVESLGTVRLKVVLQKRDCSGCAPLDLRGDLHQMSYPGESQTATIPLDDDELKLEPGLYDGMVNIIQEGYIDATRDLGATPINFSLNVK